MELNFDPSIAASYHSPTQKARVLTEGWVAGQSYCPNCGHRQLNQFEAGRRVADFFCSVCGEEFELKSKKSVLTGRVVDGAFSAMMERLTSRTNPNLFLMNYDAISHSVTDFLVVPKHFFTPTIIEKRKALSPTARRAGWVGCNILIDDIPRPGRIYLVRNRNIEPLSDVMATWQKTLFLREETNFDSKGWLLDIMSCMDKLNSNEFKLSQIYEFTPILEKLHPDNHHIKDKIRQQLQVLRDRGLLEFLGNGHYRLK
ncbi:Type II site-specific deoxyribonuclease [Dehalogenimonas lykanthroporepellens BL-DC-9]|jgi:type II restriction enzyme|nr:Type II site-specific deoxyribonuclease [Dehalogenimonas lykanthroporepellens BL-DC-9]